LAKVETNDGSSKEHKRIAESLGLLAATLVVLFILRECTTQAAANLSKMAYARDAVSGIKGAKRSHRTVGRDVWSKRKVSYAKDAVSGIEGAKKSHGSMGRDIWSRRIVRRRIAQPQRIYPVKVNFEVPFGQC
jgi:hypothetical protein